VAIAAKEVVISVCRGGPHDACGISQRLSTETGATFDIVTAPTTAPMLAGCATELASTVSTKQI